MAVAEDSFIMKNFVEEQIAGGEAKAAIHTALSMEPKEFESYLIGAPASVTYCLKELRSIIGFAECFGLPLSASFDVGGKYVLGEKKRLRFRSRNCGQGRCPDLILGILLRRSDFVQLLRESESEWGNVKRKDSRECRNPIKQAFLDYEEKRAGDSISIPRSGFKRERLG